MIAIAFGFVVVAVGLAVQSRLSTATVQEPDSAGSEGSVELPVQSSARPRAAPGGRDSGTTPPLAPAPALAHTLSAEEAAIPAVIYGRVLTSENVSPPGALVYVQRPGWTSDKVSTAGDGTFEIAVDAGHEYKVLLDESSLPVGMLAPALQDQKTYTKRPGFYATEVDIPAEGGTFEVTLRAFLGTTIRGRVVGPGGDPVPHCWVRVQNTAPALRGVATDSFTDEAGYFAVEGCRPGDDCIVQVNPLTSTIEDQQHLAIPPPLPIDVPEGADISVPTIRVGAGSNSIAGCAVDQWGSPWVDLPVRVYVGKTWLGTLATTRTDDNGCFRVDGLESTQVKVQLSEEYRSAERAIGEHNLRWFSLPIVVDLSTPDTRYDLGAITLAASEPFFFEGRIDLDETFASERRIDLEGCEVELEWLLPPSTKREPDPWAEKLPSASYDEDTGKVSWSCETPHPPVRMKVYARKAYTPEVFVEITPQPNYRDERVIDYP